MATGKIETRPLDTHYVGGTYLRTWTNKATELIWAKRCEATVTGGAIPHTTPNSASRTTTQVLLGHSSSVGPPANCTAHFSHSG